MRHRRARGENWGHLVCSNFPATGLKLHPEVRVASLPTASRSLAVMHERQSQPDDRVDRGDYTDV